MDKKWFFRTTWLSVLLICTWVIVVLSASMGPYWTKSYPLSEGLGAMHEIQVDGRAQLVLHSPSGSNYDLYAMRTPGPSGSCPSNPVIMANAEISTAGREADILVLDSGLWCLVVYAKSGAGTYLLEASAVDSGFGYPEEGMDLPEDGTWMYEDMPGYDDIYPEDGGGEEEWIPGSGMEEPEPEGESPMPEDDSWDEDGSSCTPYRTLSYNGEFQLPEGIGYTEEEIELERYGVGREPEKDRDTFTVLEKESFMHGQGETYSFEVGGPRSDIEIILQGPCEMTIPNHVLTLSEVQTVTHQDCGIISNIKLYQDCDPQYGSCNPIAESSNASPKNSYLRISEPVIGSTYYVTPFGQSDSEELRYRLTIRSFQCYL